MKYDNYCFYPNDRLARDIVACGDKYYRCSVCNRRLWPQEYISSCGLLSYRLPAHKPKGWKLAKLKAIQHKMRRKK